MLMVVCLGLGQAYAHLLFGVERRARRTRLVCFTQPETVSRGCVTYMIDLRLRAVNPR